MPAGVGIGSTSGRRAARRRVTLCLRRVVGVITLCVLNRADPRVRRPLQNRPQAGSSSFQGSRALAARKTLASPAAQLHGVVLAHRCTPSTVGSARAKSQPCATAAERKTGPRDLCASITELVRVPASARRVSGTPLCLKAAKWSLAPAPRAEWSTGSARSFTCSSRIAPAACRLWLLAGQRFRCQRRRALLRWKLSPPSTPSSTPS